MSQSTNSTSQEVIIANFVENIHAPFTFVIVVTSLCACLVSLLVVLFVFSTADLRRRLIFRLNVIAICFTLILGVLNFVVSGSAILRPFNPIPDSLYVATIVFAIFPPVFYDSILLTRLLALYPVERTPMSTLVRVLAFPLCVKCGRLLVLSLYIHQYLIITPDLTSLTMHAEATWFRNPYLTTEWTLQTFDNLYSSGFFLCKLQSTRRTSSRLTLDLFSFPQTSEIGRRMRQILYISAANFVFPVLFNIGQIICITTDRSFYVGTMLLLANSYVSVIGVLCATIWVSGGHYVQRHNPYSTSSSVGPARSVGGNRPRLATEQGTGIRIETCIIHDNPIGPMEDEDLQDFGLDEMNHRKGLSTGSFTSERFGKCVRE
ncbi:hypothetical protein EDC04DRAFT_2112489 [Pisolithus marmoratus]|nr:hypothetical protein EDC04DRAFT_2112489 [Pisolithus marmoratus]